MAAVFILWQIYESENEPDVSRKVVSPPAIEEEYTTEEADVSTTAPVSSEATASGKPEKAEEAAAEELMFIDRANPVWLSIPSQGIVVGVEWTGPAFGSTQFNPPPGKAHWWLDADVVGPCELGSAYILGHNPGEFKDLVHDPDPEVEDDLGLSVGEEVRLELEDGTVCVCRVTQFESNLGDILGQTPARRFSKIEFAFRSEQWNQLIAETGFQEPILYLLTSGGKEDEYEWVRGGWHKPWVNVIRTTCAIRSA